MQLQCRAYMSVIYCNFQCGLLSDTSIIETDAARRTNHFDRTRKSVLTNAVSAKGAALSFDSAFNQLVIRLRKTVNHS